MKDEGRKRKEERGRKKEEGRKRKDERGKSFTMHCKTCRVKMREEKRSFHKKRKWICPICGKARMQGPVEIADKKRRPA